MPGIYFAYTRVYAGHIFTSHTCGRCTIKTRYLTAKMLREIKREKISGFDSVTFLHGLSCLVSFPPLWQFHHLLALQKWPLIGSNGPRDTTLILSQLEVALSMKGHVHRNKSIKEDVQLLHLSPLTNKATFFLIFNS